MSSRFLKVFSEAEALYTRAAKLELSSDFSSAFRLYLAAADAFLHISRSELLSSTLHARCKAQAEKALDRAEKIKKASERPGARFEVSAVPIDWFGQEKQFYILCKSSIIGGVRYPFWTDVVPSPDTETLYSDPDGQPSIPQYAVSSTSDSLHNYSWNRPTHALSTWPPSLSTYSFDSADQPGVVLSSADIEQHLINDCSVCALISVCVQHMAAFQSKLLLSSIYPGKQPGRYDLKVLINGTFRRISIDDALPFDLTGRPIGTSTGVKRVVWPALIEKGYMKLMGGYDFPGSNSAIDLHALAGWIPETIGLRSSVFERERTWARVKNGFRNGHCVFTVGTDFKTTRKIEDLRLLPLHNYAVVDIGEACDERWVTLIDSRIPKPSLATDGNDSRTLRVRWDDLCATFEGIYVSWDPKLFHEELSFHGIWRSGNAEDKEQSCIRHLRLLYTYVPRAGSSSLHSGGARAPSVFDNDIWVLLVRHISDTRRTGEYIALTVDVEGAWANADATAPDGVPHLARERAKAEMEVKGSYTSSSHVLVRTIIHIDDTNASPSSPLPSTAINSTPFSGALTILTSYDGPFDDVCFSVSVFCGSWLSISWDEKAGVGGIGVKGHSMKIEGALTAKNAGGNHTYPTYMLNPQWHLSMPDQGSTTRILPPVMGGESRGFGALQDTSLSPRNRAAVVLNAQGPRDVPLNLTAVWSAGERVAELTQREIVASSGAYTYGRARAFANLTPGNYTLILSAFEPQVHLGPFTLRIEGSRQFELTPIPQEGAGMYTRVTKGEWDSQTAVGGPSYGRYHLNPVYEVDIPSTAQFGARLHLTSTSQSASLNLLLFPVTSPASFDRPIASSGPYSDSLAGVDIPKQTLGAGKYWLLPSTWTAGVQARFKLVVYCSDAGCAVSRRVS